MTELDQFHRVAERLIPGGKLLDAWRLTGGVSTDVHALRLKRPDGRQTTLVLRQYRPAAWKGRDPHVVTMEYELQRALFGQGFPVAEPLQVDGSREILPTPYLAMVFLDGSSELLPTELKPSLDIMAATLAALHALPLNDLPSLPMRNDPLPELFDYLPAASDWRALRSRLSAPRATAYGGPPALLHGDFWPGNLLWKNGRLTGILDWEDAALGDPVSDLAGARLELLWKYGRSAMDRFTRAYARRRAVDAGRLALWQVFVSLAACRFMGGWGLEPGQETRMRMTAIAHAREAAAQLS